jgi:hypothetical protein
VPTLLLRGEPGIVTADATRALLRLLRNGRCAEIAGPRHMVQFDQPAAWRDAVAAFVAPKIGDSALFIVPHHQDAIQPNDHAKSALSPKRFGVTLREWDGFGCFERECGRRLTGKVFSQFNVRFRPIAAVGARGR